jgi:Fe-S-cluster-containing hydrogenase component 2
MKRLSVKKNIECMACLECVRACSTAFYKEFNPDLSCIQIVAKGDGAKPMTCIQCGKCMKACEAGAIAIDKFCAKVDYDKCTGCGKCHEVCPVGSIDLVDLAIKE